MPEMKPEERTIFPEASISQLEVGKLTISAQAFSLGKEIQFSHKIIIHKEDGTPGWGKRIFEGTLKDLVDLMDKVKECPFVKEDKDGT